jgi:hypothetical protein
MVRVGWEWTQRRGGLMAMVSRVESCRLLGRGRSRGAVARTSATGTDAEWVAWPNKRMQLTKLRAAPVWQAEVPPCAPAGETDGGTASQLIRGVGPTIA